MILHFWRRWRKDGGISGPAAVVLDSEVRRRKSSHGLEATVGNPLRCGQRADHRDDSASGFLHVPRVETGARQ